MDGFLEQVRYRLRWAWAAGGRLWRLIVFGFELIVLSRLLEGRKATGAVAHAVLKTKGVEIAPPELQVSTARGPVDHWSHGFTSVYAALFLNLRGADQLCAARHARPAPPFRAIYLWDSAFIAQVWKWWDAGVAWEVLHAVLQLRDGDRLQHYVSEYGRSKFTQPPLLAWSLMRLEEATEPARYRDWVQRSYERLRAYHIWLNANRRLPNGLYAWAHPYESGIENAPRFGTRDERRLRDTRALASPDFSSYVALHCEALASMARCIGRDDDAQGYEREWRELRTAVNEELWDEEFGTYFDRDTQTGELVRSHTIASLLPLWAGLPDQARAQRLQEHVLDPGAFNTLIPLPSVALNDERFERDMWRGPVWVNTAFAVIEGLRRYGLHAAASDLAFRLCDGVYRTFAKAGHFYEFYDPTAYGVAELHRKRGNRWKRLTLGGGPVPDFVGWTGLVNTLVLETLLGVGEGSFTPRFPARARGWRFKFSLPAQDLNLDLEVLADGATRGEVRQGAIVRPFEAPFGTQVSFQQLERTRVSA